MRFLPWLVLVPLAVVNCSSSKDASGGHFTVLDPGSGPSNARPLDPLPVGERRSSPAAPTVVIAALQRNGVTVKQVLGTDGTVVWISENGDGQFLFASSLDGVLSDPVLLVPASVKVGMKWQAGAYTFTVTDSKTMPTVLGAQVVWTIVQSKDDATVERQYIEGYGQMKVGTTVFSSFVIPLEPPAPPVDDDAPVAPTPLTGAATQLSVTAQQPVFLSALDDGAGSLTLGVTSLQLFYDSMNGRYVPVPAYDCSTFHGGALSAGCMQPTMPNSDYSGAVRVGGAWSIEPRDGYGRPKPVALGLQNFRYLDAAGQPHDATSRSNASDWSVDFGPTTTLRGSPDFSWPRYEQFLGFPTRSYLPALQVDANGVLPFAIWTNSGIVTSSHLRFTATDGHVEPPTPVGVAFGTQSVRTSPTEREMLFALPDGTITRVQNTADGTALETLAHVAVPAGKSLVGAVRITRDGHARADDALLVAIYNGPTLAAGLKLYTTSLATVPQHPRPVATPASLAVSAVRAGVDAEVCWPASTDTGLGSGWQLGGLAVAATYRGDQAGTCVLLVRDASLRAAAATTMAPIDAWHIEGTIPGIGKVALAINDAHDIGGPTFTATNAYTYTLAPLRGGGFIDTNGKLSDPDGLIVDDGDMPGTLPTDVAVKVMPNGTGFLWFHGDDPVRGSDAPYLVGRTTRPIALPSGACTMPPCKAGMGGVAVQQGGGYVVPIGNIPGQPVVFAPDGTATLATAKFPFRVTVAPGNTVIANQQELAHLTDGSYCSASTTASGYYLWCVDAAGTVRSKLWTPAPTGGAFSLHAFSDGTFLVATPTLYRFDAAALTLTLLATVPPVADLPAVRMGTDGSLWAQLYDPMTLVPSIHRVDPTGTTRLVGSENVNDFYVDEKFVYAILLVNKAGVSVRFPRP